MFYGSYIVKVDDKYRVFIPSTFRKELKEKELMLTLLDQDNIIVMNVNEWKPENVLSCYDFSKLTSSKKEYLLKYIKLSSSSCKLDSQGRIIIPIQFRKLMSISESCVIYGNGDNIVITNRELFESKIGVMNREVNNYIDNGVLKLKTR